jgi:dTDP-4-dehydrorhamnose 3,5-epimerase
VKIRQLSIAGAYEITPVLHGDPRGLFTEWYRFDHLAAELGHPLRLAQANLSVSSRGVVRGIHYADVPPGQAKYVTCQVGAIVDVVVDIRVGSETFGRWESVTLQGGTGRSVYLSEGLGHAFVAVEDQSVVSYLCSTPYAPQREHGVNPADPALGIDWQGWLPEGVELLLSDKDRDAPSLQDAEAEGLLPSLAECERFVASLRGA